MVRNIILCKILSFLLSILCFASIAHAGLARDCISKANEKNLADQEKKEYIRACIGGNGKAGANQGQSMAGSADASGVKKKSSGFQVIGTGPISAEAAASMCAPGLGNGRVAISKVEFFPSINAADISGSDQLSIRTGKAYPIRVQSRAISEFTNIPYNRRGFIYKNAFGKWECQSDPDR